MLIRPVETSDRPAITPIVLAWGAEIVVSHATIFRPLDLPGFVAVDETGSIVGLVTYNMADEGCEIVTLDSLTQWRGIGTALIEAVCETAQANQCRRVWLITTNDNVDAVRFYQRRGFVLKAVHINALEQSRKLKPQIPLIGNHGIPIRDELEFERILC